MQEIVGPYSDLRSGKNPRYSKKLRALEEQLDDAVGGVKALAENSSLLAAAAITSTKVLSETRQLVFLKDMLQKTGDMLKSGVNPNFVALARSMGLLKDGTDELRDGLNSAQLTKLSMAAAAAGDTILEAQTQAAGVISTIEAAVNDAGRAAIANIKSNSTNPLAQLAQIQNLANSATAEKIFGIDPGDGKEFLPDKINKDVEKVFNGVKQQLQEQGVAVGLLNGSSEQLATAFGQLQDETLRVNKTFVSTVQSHVSAMGQLTQTANVARHSIHQFGQNVLHAATQLGSLASIQQKVGNLYQEAMMFNVSHVADNFINLQVQSIRLGMSFKDTVALYQQNARLLAVQGKGSFQSSLANLKDTFNAYGYTFEQGSKMLAPAIENAVLSGVNVRDQGAVSDYMKQTLHNAQLMSTVTGRMPEDIIKVQQSLLQSESVFNTMAGMDKQRRAAYAKEMLQTVDRLVLDGMEYEQAAEVLKIQQQTARAPVREKAQKAAMGMNASRIAGMSAEDARRLFKLEMQTGYAAGEQQEMARLQTMRAQGMEAGLQEANARTGYNALAFLNMQQAVGSNIFGADVAKIGMQAQLRKDAGLGLTPEQAEAQRQAAAGNAKLAALGQTVDQVSSLLKNTLFSSASAAALGLGAAAVSAMKVAFVFNKLAGGSLFGGAGGGGGGKLGKFAGMLGKGGLAGLALGVGGNIAGDAVGGTRGSVISNAANIAAIGATLGSVIPGVGTLLGAGIGGLVGGAYGYFTSPGSTSAAGAVNTEALAAESMNGLSGSSLTVVDTGAHAHLQTIAASMNEAVELLRVLTTTGGTASQRAGSAISAIPNAAQYVTGNG